jgi:alkanesulfonate monooxygenase SsuD/methylene tetrahydromethanopterin reductase-like flavin-dependent oxidoreductase (luciferase family)
VGRGQGVGRPAGAGRERREAPGVGPLPQAPFAPGSISLGIHAHDLGAKEQVEDLLEQAALAEEVGFDGVTVSEHHAGFSTYLPNPLLVLSWLLERLERAWVGACPMLLSARPAAHVCEDLAWLAARHPGRLGAAFAPGYVERDFAAAGHGFGGRRERHWRELPVVVAALAGRPPAELAGDRALAACAADPVPVLSTAETARAAARAGAAGAGILLGAYNSAAGARALFEAYTAAGGAGPRVLIRRAHVGPLSAEARDGLASLYASAGATEGAALLAGDASTVAAGLAGEYGASGATALNLRVNVLGIGPAETRQQIRALGALLEKISPPPGR